MNLQWHESLSLKVPAWHHSVSYFRQVLLLGSSTLEDSCNGAPQIRLEWCAGGRSGADLAVVEIHEKMNFGPGLGFFWLPRDFFEFHRAFDGFRF